MSGRWFGLKENLRKFWFSERKKGKRKRNLKICSGWMDADEYGIYLKVTSTH